MSDPLWDSAGRYTLGAVALSLAVSAGLLIRGTPLDAAGLMAGALLSSANFLATSRFLDASRRAARTVAAPGASDQAAADPHAATRAALGFVFRYFVLGAALALLILVAGLPAVPTVLGVAALPLTIYLWQMVRLFTRGWRT